MYHLFLSWANLFFLFQLFQVFIFGPVTIDVFVKYINPWGDLKGGAQEGKQDPGADFEEKTLILEVPRNENKILGQTEEKHQSWRCPAREKKIMGQTLQETVFCYHNCSNLLWEKIVLVWGKNWEKSLQIRGRKAENL